MIKVFLVDDEVVIREGIRTSFPWDETEYTLVGEAPDGEIALPMIRDTNPDILITDIRMPFMDGIELCRTVRSRMPWIGVIILSGYDDFEYARKGIQLGVKEYLLKPISAEELRQVLDRVSESMKRDKQERERSERLRRRLESGDQFLRDKLLSALFSEESGEADAEGIITQLENLGMNIRSPYYAVIDAAFTPIREGQDALWELAEASGGIVRATACRTGSRLLVLGKKEADAEEQAYAFGASAADELERSGCGKIRISIGEIVDKPDLILHSMKTARHLRHMLGDGEEKPVIIGVRETGDLPDGKKSVSAEARLWLSQNYTNANLMLQDAAQAVGMSNSRFSTVFAQETGNTFTEYLTMLRLNRAKELLRETDRKSGQIALDVGYNDSHYFSYLFKKNTGMTPGEYRTQYENEPER